MLSLACLALISRTGLAGLVEAEANFATSVRVLGSKQALQRVISPGAKVFGGVKDRPGTRAAKPAFAGLSRSEDWGFTAGPYASPGVPNAGNYVSVWRKSKQRWQLVLDFHVSRTPPLDGFSELSSQYRHTLRADSATALTGLLATDRALGSVGWKRYRAFLDPSGIVLRGGSKAARSAGASIAIREENWMADKAMIAPSADLGCTYGTLTFGSAGRGDYVRIWARDELGSWRILVDAATRRPISD